MEEITVRETADKEGRPCILFKDYLKVASRAEKYETILKDARRFVKCLYDGGYLTEKTEKNILDRLGE